MASTQSKTVTGLSLRILKDHPYLFVFPILGSVLSSIVWLIGGLVLLTMYGFSSVSEDARRVSREGTRGLSEPGEPSIVAVIIVVAITAYVATIFYQFMMAGLVKCADEELQGRPSSVGAGLGAAAKRTPALLGWSAIQAAVSWLISMVQGNGNDGNILVTILRYTLAFLLSVAWYTVTLFVLPLIVLRGKGPIEAIKESFALIRRTWGARSRLGIRLGGGIWTLFIVVSFLIGLAGIFVLTMDIRLGIGLIVIAVIAIVVLNLLLAALRVVFGVALLHYVEDGAVVGPYQVEQLHAAVRARAA